MIGDMKFPCLQFATDPPTNVSVTLSDRYSFGFDTLDGTTISRRCPTTHPDYDSCRAADLWLTQQGHTVADLVDPDLLAAYRAVEFTPLFGGES